MSAACGGELERKRYAVELVADLGNRRRVVLADGERRPRATRPVNEQSNRVVLRHRVNCDGRLRDGCRKGRHAPDNLSGNAEWLSARHEDRDREVADEQCFDERRARGGQLLTIVEHQKTTRRSEFGRDFID